MAFFSKSKSVDPNTGIIYTHHEPTILPRSGSVWKEGKNKPYTIRTMPKKPDPWYKSFFRAKGKKITRRKKKKGLFK